MAVRRQIAIERNRSIEDDASKVCLDLDDHRVQPLRARVKAQVQRHPATLPHHSLEDRDAAEPRSDSTDAEILNARLSSKSVARRVATYPFVMLRDSAQTHPFLAAIAGTPLALMQKRKPR